MNLRSGVALARTAHEVMTVFAFIPARGGSKGIPRKNLREVGGVPLVARTVAAALAAERIDRVLVTTDDAEIAAGADCALTAHRTHAFLWRNDKVPALQRWLQSNDVRAEDTVYVGNDVNDLGCMALVGCGVAVADAHPDAIRAADLVLGQRGGPAKRIP